MLSNILMLFQILWKTGYLSDIINNIEVIINQSSSTLKTCWWPKDL